MDSATDEPSASISDAAAVREAAFRTLIADGTAALPEIATAAGLSGQRTRHAAEMLVDGGLMVLHGERVMGVAGLSLRATAHRMRLGSRWWHTWCAYDAVGIPAALGADAQVRTRCPLCGATIALSVTAGHPPPASPLRCWLPQTAGTDPIRRFCPLANLFCDRAHLDQWWHDAGEPGGRVCTPDDLAELGIGNWGPLR